MTRRAMFPLIDRALGGDLEARLREWRSTTPPTSFERIAHEQGVKLRWGGDFDQDGRTKGEKLIDMPHLEIAE